MTESLEIVPAPTTSLQLGAVPMATHKEVITHATEVAKSLAQIIEDCRLFVNIQGKKFVRVEGWETLGAMLGIIPREEAVVEKEDGEIEAAVELILVSTGQRVGRGSAIVGADEKSWQSRPKYARRSMAITRATGKAFRLSLSWIMSMAGYEPTPAEEMDNVVEGQFTEHNEPKPRLVQEKRPAVTPDPKLKALVDSGVAENIPNAAKILNLAKVPLKTPEDAVAWGKTYRGWRDIDKTVEEAAENTNKGLQP